MYDSNVYSDQAMLEMGQEAGAKGYAMYVQNPAENAFTVEVNGVHFEVHINFDPKTGAAYVGNVYPVKGN